MNVAITWNAELPGSLRHADAVWDRKVKLKLFRCSALARPCVQVGWQKFSSDSYCRLIAAELHESDALHEELMILHKSQQERRVAAS